MSQDNCADKSKQLTSLLNAYNVKCTEKKQRAHSRILKCIAHEMEKENNEGFVFNLNGSGLDEVGKLTDYHVITLCETLMEFIELKVCELDLSMNRITNKSMDVLGKYVEANKDLISLNLRGNDICDGMEHVISVLNKSSLMKLNLNNTDMDDDVVCKLSHKLKDNSKLIELDIGNCDFGHKGFTYIMKNIEGNSTLKKLNIENILVKSLTNEIFMNISDMLLRNNCLESLNISKFGEGGITNYALKYICNSLNNNYSLKELNIGCNKIGADGIRYLSNTLNNMTKCNISKLILCGNRLTDLSTKYLCEILLKSQKLNYLDLRGCSFTDMGLTDIGKIILQLKEDNILKLKTILLDNNQFGQESIQIWSKIVETRYSNIIDYDFYPQIQDYCESM